MKRQKTFAILYTPTLIDADGVRHIIPSRDKPAYCGATGEQRAPAEHHRQDICPRCLQRYMRVIFDIHETSNLF